MPTPIMHLVLAEEILQEDDLVPEAYRLLTQQRGSFLLGHTAPDVQTVSGQDREETHFYAIPRTTDRPAYKALFAAHPRLARADRLFQAHAAFIAGYVTHLLLDEIWLDHIFWPYFGDEERGRRERLFSHNVLRTWMDRQDQRRLNGTVRGALEGVDPQDWLPFVEDVHVRVWRDWLVGQLAPGHTVQTVAVFARRMGISEKAIETVLDSPEELERCIFRYIPREALRTYVKLRYERSVALINGYLGSFSR